MKPAYVIAADDFGLRPACNERILALVSEGLIDRVGIMTDGAVSETESATLVRSGVLLDIHLDFDTVKSSQKSSKGNPWSRGFRFVFDFLFGRLRPSMVRREWTRQLEAFKVRFGRYPDGINSHEHLHFFPPYFFIAASLARERGIPYIRFGSVGILKSSNLVSIILRVLRVFDRRSFERSLLRSSSVLASLDWIPNPETPAYTGTGEIELVTHPERAEETDAIRIFRNAH
ncbi:MAG: ChbG/HpnK family deacetylase [Candidatus Moraniibacteriota bacterium]